MVEKQEVTGKVRRMELEMKFNEACAHLDAGRNREAFRLLQEAAWAGHVASLLNLGYCFDVGRGVRRSRDRALFWYRKAVSKGDGAAANNIATIYRDEGRPRLAARWFQKAVSLGATDALLELARLYIEPFNDPAKARSALARVARARNVTEDTREQAKALLSRVQPRRKTRIGS